MAMLASLALVAKVGLVPDDREGVLTVLPEDLLLLPRPWWFARSSLC